MVRDFLRDKNYFEEFIKDEEANIERYEQAMAMVIEQRGEDDEGVQAGYTILTGYYFIKLNALYSAGRPIEEIRNLLPKVIELMKKSWDGNDYEQMLSTLSISVMLDIENNQFEQLIEMVRKHNLHDSLIEFLIQGKQHEKSTLKGQLLFEVPYLKLVQVIQSNQTEAVIKLKDYLEKYWYEGHNDSGWYDTHKNSDDIYNGYWSFESGAVAKILRLDDSILKDVPYYPYDLVHYNN
ncbi:PoNi-like cognate immunity protein [Bhargavaea massiliensis]|uniref:PoNi-like cognate immunity protein n=1 Tax=Bhargavaea massiliensis TaxID=2697500 RepID=UPI001BD18EE3|nr:PoNi-like cognate immunity protein [Bhargavaea massiliensis]